MQPARGPSLGCPILVLGCPDGLAGASSDPVASLPDWSFPHSFQSSVRADSWDKPLIPSPIVFCAEPWTRPQRPRWRMKEATEGPWARGWPVSVSGALLKAARVQGPWASPWSRVLCRKNCLQTISQVCHTAGALCPPLPHWQGVTMILPLRLSLWLS